MTDSEGVIRKPVRLVHDVASVLNSTSKSLSNLCRDGGINKWSKFKPVNSTKVTELTEADRRALNWGFQIQEYQSAAFFMNAAINGSAVWTYPQRIAPYRLLDFNGYNHSATAPLTVALAFTDISTADNDDIILTSNPDFTGEHFSAFDGKYFCAVFRKVTGTQGSERVVTASSQNETMISFRASDLGEGMYYVAFGYCSAQFSLTGAVHSAMFVPLPQPLYPQRLTVTLGTGITVSCENAYTTSTGINWRLRLSTVTQKYIYNVKVYYDPNLSGAQNIENGFIPTTITLPSLPDAYTILLSLNLSQYMPDWMNNGRLYLEYAYNYQTYKIDLTQMMDLFQY